MNIEEIIKNMKESNNFKVKEPNGLPQLANNHRLPDDVRRFYNMCGGIECYTEQGGFPITILPSSDVKLANYNFFGEKYDDDISSSWYLIADAQDGNYISIDFSPTRIGKCYESFEYTHGIAGNCPIIALTFSELLMNIFVYSGEYFFWKDNLLFKGYGDAYE